jgi:hypothetical protein
VKREWLDAKWIETMNHTLVSGGSLSSGGHRPTEKLALNFTKV